MSVWTMEYRFRQSFRVSPQAAFSWCTDYQSDDPGRMGDEGTRRVRWLSDDLVILTDHFKQGRSSVVKKKLVHLIPDRLSWTSTHLAGPIRQSQFLYSIHPRGRGRSYLEFTGLQVETRSQAPTPARRAAAARELRRVDSATWRQLARQLHSDLNA
jgi:hypothetical protein